MTSLVLAGPWPAAWAGRPLTVDDAATNEAGHGHVELWGERAPGAARVYTLAPAYAPRDGVELAASLSRDTTQRMTAAAVQVKWLFGLSRDDGCNTGASLGASHVAGEGDAAFVNGLLSCNGTPLGNLHANLGAIRPSDATAFAAWGKSWGVALERPLAGGVATPHVEWFGERHATPTLQIGLRSGVSDSLQIDGTLGHGKGTTVYSVGAKLQF